MLLAGLVLAGWGMLRLAHAPGRAAAGTGTTAPTSAEALSCGFGLKLSAEAELVELRGRDGKLLFRREHSAGPFTGLFALDVQDPAVFVKVTWKPGQAAGSRFVRLSLEPAGKPTLTRYFEARGDIDDVWEPSSE